MEINYCTVIMTVSCKTCLKQLRIPEEMLSLLSVEYKGILIEFKPVYRRDYHIDIETRKEKTNGCFNWRRIRLRQLKAEVEEKKHVRMRREPREILYVCSGIKSQVKFEK